MLILQKTCRHAVKLTQITTPPAANIFTVDDQFIAEILLICEMLVILINFLKVRIHTSLIIKHTRPSKKLIEIIVYLPLPVGRLNLKVLL